MPQATDKQKPTTTKILLDWLTFSFLQETQEKMSLKLSRALLKLSSRQTSTSARHGISLTVFKSQTNSGLQLWAFYYSLPVLRIVLQQRQLVTSESHDILVIGFTESMHENAQWKASLYTKSFPFFSVSIFVLYSSLVNPIRFCRNWLDKP